VIPSFHRLRSPSGAEVSLGEPASRMLVLALLGAVLGGVGGVVAFLVVRLVGLISNLALLHRVGFHLPVLRHYHPGPELIAVAVGGALAVALLALWSPVIKGHGIPESLEAVLLRESRIKPRVLVAKPISAAVAMGTGGPFGAEGPIIVTGGCIGSLLGQWIRVSPAERRILLATGAAAGMAGVFDTPVAAIIIAFELLLFERSLRSLLPLILATGLASEIHTLLIGAHPLFAVTFPLTYSAPQIPLFCLLGLACGVLAIVVNKGLFAVEAGFRRLPVSEFFHPVVGAVGFAAIGLAVPGSLSVGYWAITDAVNGRFLLGAAAAIFVAKLCSWWIALASNTSGGTLAPIFLIGATMGEMLGIGFAHAFPSLHLDPAAFALVAMGATFGAAARAPLTGAVFAIEVTGAYHLLIPMLLALGIAEVVTELFLTERLMTDKLVRRGFRVEFDTEVDPFRTAVAGQAMDPLPPGPPLAAVATDAWGNDATATSATLTGSDVAGQTVDRFAYLRDALAIFLAEKDAARVVVTDHDAPIGTISRQTMAEVLARRVAESDLQPPSLNLRSRSAPWLRAWAAAHRIPRLDQTHRHAAVPEGVETGETEGARQEAEG
jgi:chloride channel protein, CIC family